MGNQNNADAFRSFQLQHGFQHFFSSARVKHGGRLIEHNDLRLHRKGSGNSNALFLSAGQVIRRFQAIGLHMYCGKGILYSLPYFIGRKTDVLRTESNVLFHHRCYNLIIGILEDHPHFSSDGENVLLLPTVHP